METATRNYVSNRIGYHPGTRVIVEAEASRGTPIRSDKSSVIRQYLAEFRSLGYCPYRICFESTARDPPAKGSDTWMRVRANPRSRFVTAKLIKSDFDRAQINECILHATRSIRLRHPLLFGAFFTLRVRVIPGDAPLAPAVSMTERPSTVDPVVFREAFGPIQESIEHCIREGFRHDPKLWGRMALLLQFDRAGRVVSATEHNSHFPDPSVVRCSTLAAHELRLPELVEPGSILIALKVGALPPSSDDSTGQQQEPPQTSPISATH